MHAACSMHCEPYVLAILYHCQPSSEQTDTPYRAHDHRGLLLIQQAVPTAVHCSRSALQHSAVEARFAHCKCLFQRDCLPQSLHTLYGMAPLDCVHTMNLFAICHSLCHFAGGSTRFDASGRPERSRTAAAAGRRQLQETPAATGMSRCTTSRNRQTFHEQHQR